jgi:tetratricopeptide (TPR) repeat protein
MNLSPWNYWYRDGSPYTRTKVVMNVLQGAIESNPEHTGALHYYIHITESQIPKQAEAAADQLDGLAPGAGHLVHMPSHIYMRIGRYADSYRVNRAAAKADKKYIAACQAQGLYPVGYYPHNVHFLVWSAQFLGRSKDAMKAARKIRDEIPEFVGVQDQVPADVRSDAWHIYETFMSQPLYTMIRFGMWDEILAETQPARQARFMNGVWHYARGLAFVNNGGIAAARHELGALTAILAEQGIYEYPASLNGAGSLLDIAMALLAGEIEAATGNYAEAISLMERAVRLQDGLHYMEPPDWFFPSRHYLGAVLLDAGLAAQAETIYWDDLRKMPNNGFALFGLQQAQFAQDKVAEAERTREKFADVWADADVELTSSRF